MKNKKLKKNSIIEVIKQLSKKPRFAGSSFVNESAEFIKSIFKEYGYNVKTKIFPLLGE